MAGDEVSSTIVTNVGVGGIRVEVEVTVSGKATVTSGVGGRAVSNMVGLKAVNINQANPPQTASHNSTPNPKALIRPSGP